MREGNIKSWEQVQQYKVNRPGEVEAIRQSLYDSATYIAAGQTSLQFFQTPIGQGATTVIGNTGVKTRRDTNMELAGVLPQPKNFLAESIELYLFPTTFPNQTSAVTVDINDFANDVYEISRAGSLDFFIGSKTYLEEAPLLRFPPKTKLHTESSVAVDVVEATAPVVKANSYAQFAGRPYYLDPPILLQSNQNFSVTLRWDAVVAVTEIVRVVCVLDGVLYRLSQ